MSGPNEDVTNARDVKGEPTFIRWCRYYYNTELFDRSVCHVVSPFSKDALPVTSEQRSLCTANALRELRRLGLCRMHDRRDRDEAERLTMRGLRRVLDGWTG